MSDRDALGRIVREAWVRWALTQPNPKPTWLAPYDELSEPDKEADRQIAEAVIASVATKDVDAFWSMVEHLAAARMDSRNIGDPPGTIRSTEIILDAEMDGDSEGGRAKFIFGEDGKLSKVEVYEHGSCDDDCDLPRTY